MTSKLSSSTPLLGDKGQGSQQTYFSSPLDQNVYVIDSHLEHERRRQRVRRHRWCFVLVLATVILVSSWKGVYRFAHSLVHHHRAEIMSGEPASTFDIWPGDPEGDFDCINGDQWDDVDTVLPNIEQYHHFSAKTSFKLPIDSDALAFVARGAWTYGHVDVVAGDGDEVSVDVVAEYHNRPALDRVTVCRFHYDRDGRDGVGIFSPRERHRHDRRETVYLHMVIRLPAHGRLIRQVPSFFTAMPLYSQTVNDLTEGFEFGRISLASTNQQIHVKDIRAHDINVHTTNAAIIGAFNTSDSLKLATTNSPIKVDVTAFNHDNANDLILHTTNALLAANFSLLQSPASSSAARFKVTTATTNGHLRVNYLTSPADAVLEATASTTNSPAWVRLDSAYEGTFAASTTHFTPSIERRTDVEDPAGRRRSRHVEVNTQIRGFVRGFASWLPSEHEKGQPGSINVHTTNNHLFLSV
ncbi:unnamed protein product [Peniophora sp. CBMAI 1063]|nr:unnamed protein product [Peniophora sp. CBMAI 1063]